jgi:hypothetical protein
MKTPRHFLRSLARAATLLSLLAVLLAAPALSRAAQTDIPSPPGSGRFGSEVTYLPNGNFVVTDPPTASPRRRPSRSWGPSISTMAPPSPSSAR